MSWAARAPIRLETSLMTCRTHIQHTYNTRDNHILLVPIIHTFPTSSGPLPPTHVIDESRIGLIEVLVVYAVLPVSPDATNEGLNVLPRVAREIKTLEGNALCGARRQLGLAKHNMSVDNRVHKYTIHSVHHHWSFG